jgi:hypothetical protein
VNSKQIVAAAAFLLVGSSAIAQTSQTFTGTVGDVMCGKKHLMLGMSPQKCTRECVKAGSDFALIVGDKVYTLKGEKETLDKVAGATATVRGKLSGNTINVESVQAAQ